MWSFKRHALQKNGVVNRDTPSKFLHLLLSILISLASFSINPALAKCSNKTSNGSNEQVSNNNQYNKQISNCNRAINNCNFKAKDQILIFVSFSLPDAALQSYYQETQLLGGKLVMRGLKNNSFKDTQAKTMKLEINFDIDPTLFEKYAVTRVPTIILISDRNVQDNNKSNNQLQYCKPTYVKNHDQAQKHKHQQPSESEITKKITGHIPLSKALEIMEEGI